MTAKHPYPAHVVDALKEKIAEVHGDLLACTRVAEAWSYGTMTQDDFIEIGDDPDVLHDLTTTALDTLWSVTPHRLSVDEARTIWQHAVKAHQGDAGAMNDLRVQLCKHAPDWGQQ